MSVPDFTIAAAQITVTPGNVLANVAAHAAAAAAAAAAGVTVVIFPELSLTGYEPDLAASLAFTADDPRLAILQETAARHRITITAGAPVPAAGKPAIAAFLFSPGAPIRTYRKTHLGTTEPRYFSPGGPPLAFDLAGQRLGLAICADSSRPSHPQTYAELGATIYAAGVCFTEEWYREDAPRFPRYAAEFGLLAVMANQGTSNGSYASVGRSAIWAPGGKLLAQAPGVEDALVTATFTAGSWHGRTVPLAAMS
jgi:predicted amidohydrolase